MAVSNVFSLLIGMICAYFEALWDRIVPKKPKDVSGLTVVVTGASRGIGKEMATKLARLGAKVALWDINEQENVKSASEITNMGSGTARAYTCDVTSYESVQKAAKLTKQELGDPNILINNAGILLCKDILTLTEKEIRKTIDVNTLAHFWTVKEFLPAMLDQNSGHVVTIASMAGKSGVSLLTDYCASKFGAYGFTEALSMETRKHFGKTGIHFTTVCPMFVNTNLVTGLTNRIDCNPGRGEKMLEPDEVAEAVISGMLRNKRYVYIPKHLANIDLIRSIMPLKASRLAFDFNGAGFTERS